MERRTGKIRLSKTSVLHLSHATDPRSHVFLGDTVYLITRKSDVDGYVCCVGDVDDDGLRRDFVASRVVVVASVYVEWRRRTDCRCAGRSSPRLRCTCTSTLPPPTALLQFTSSSSSSSSSSTSSPSPFILFKRNNNITIKWQKNRTARRIYHALEQMPIVIKQY